MLTITALETHDVRFPTSRELDGSDAMNPHPDYSAAYVILRTDTAWEGHGLAVTIGRRNAAVIAAIHGLAPLVVRLTLGGVTAGMSGLWRSLARASQLRSVRPEKGGIH